MYRWAAKAQGDLEHAQDDVNRHILRMLEGTFLHAWPIYQCVYLLVL